MITKSTRTCYLCRDKAIIQSSFCESHGSVCQVRDNNGVCNKPASFGCGICKHHHEHESNAIDDAIRWIDRKCWDGEWEEIDHQLCTLDVNAMTPALCVTWLSMTRCVSQHLPSRPAFFEKTRERLRQHRIGLIPPDLHSIHNIDEDVDATLSGLK